MLYMFYMYNNSICSTSNEDLIIFHDLGAKASINLVLASRNKYISVIDTSIKPVTRNCRNRKKHNINGCQVRSMISYLEQG